MQAILFSLIQHTSHYSVGYLTKGRQFIYEWNSVKLQEFPSKSTLILQQRYHIVTSWWTVKALPIYRSRISPWVLFQFFCLYLAPIRARMVLSYQNKVEVLCLTSQHIQALHHRESHSIDPEVALCAIVVLGLCSALCRCLSADVLWLKLWIVGQLKKNRKQERRLWEMMFLQWGLRSE